MRRRSEKKGSAEKEVEELLRAAEDEMLLKFSVNSHTTRSNLDLELLRRFEALKSPSIKKESSSSNSVIRPKRKEEGEKKDVVEKLDLSTRFESLKGKGASSSSTAGISERSSNNGFDRDESSENEEDEVAKVIQWAMDAARLDPSKTDDDEDEGDVEDESGDDDDDDDDEEDDRKRKPKK